MAQQTINVGTVANDGTGDPGRDAFIKVNDNFTEIYTVSLNSSGTVDGTDQLFTGHVAIGGNASVSAVKPLIIDEEISMPSGVFGAIDSIITAVGGNIAAQPSGISLSILIDNLGAFSIPSGINAVNTVTANQASNLLRVNGYLSQLKSDSGFAFNMGNCAHFDIRGGSYSGGKPVTETGIVVANLGKPGMTTAMGIEVTKQASATNNLGIVLSGDGIGADIVFGQGNDANIYYDGTDLAIDTALAGSGTLDLVSQTASAITTETLNEYITIKIGGVSKKIAIVA